ncbi:homogentisate 1,2-dioxygenase [Novosphingobium clariflavum]|uniref:Homogentisate 1,2-dioxygenase n=1 Tax=Novosphingobium clariflavum TaxID=2029884 RepID=A0ABV6S5R5_9SPHN|nr:homogentisate 1,2-dioxygenase [Novosphingobium clariflavum]
MSDAGAMLAALLALALPGSAAAQDHAAAAQDHAPADHGAAAGEVPAIVPSPIACPAVPAPLPGELAAWNRRVPLAAAQDPAAAALLAPGVAIDAALIPSPQVRYALAPKKPGASASFGGLYRFSVATAGHYRVALGAAAWIDVIPAPAASAASLPSIAHGHGPDCSGIRKMVDFALEPGDYLLQIAASPDATLPLLVTPLP